MKVTEYIENVNKITAERYDFSQHLKTKYLPYADKLAIATRAISASTYENINGINIYKQNTPMMMLFYKVGMIEKYTDIEIENPVKDYDMLCQAGLLNILLFIIPEDELKLCKKLLDMTKADLMENTRSVVSFMETKVESMSQFLMQMSNIFTPEMIAKLQAQNN